jgi:hypothetical protein
MIRPWKMLYSALHSIIGVARSFGAKFKDTPIVSVAGGNKGYEARKRVAVGARRVRYGRSGCYDDCKKLEEDQSSRVKHNELSSVT